MYRHVVLAAALAGGVLLAFACSGTDVGPTGMTPTAQSMPASTGFEPSSASLSAQPGLVGEDLPTTPIGDILANPVLGNEYRVEAIATRLSENRYTLADDSSTIQANFPPDGLQPDTGEPVRVVGTLVSGGGGFPFELDVTSWQSLAPFNCDDVVEARARFSDPGFVAGDVVGLFLSFRGVPAGQKMLEIRWDEGNPDGLVQRASVGEGVSRGDGLFDLEGVVGHEYGVTSTQTKTVRALLTIEGRDGSCTRVRDVTVTQGSGPGFAAGGALSLSFNDPVPSGGFFSVTATVKNPTSVPLDATLVFATPVGTTVRTMGAGCGKLKDGLVECSIPGIKGNGRGEEFVQYNVPIVVTPTDVSGSVTYVGRDLSPVAQYTTTVEP